MNRRAFVGAIGMALAGAMCGGAVPAPQGVSIGHSKCAKCGNTLYTLEAAGAGGLPGRDRSATTTTSAAWRPTRKR